VNPVLVVALIQAAAAYGPAIVSGLQSLVSDRSDKTDAEMLTELDALIEACKASDDRIQAHQRKQPIGE